MKTGLRFLGIVVASLPIIACGGRIAPQDSALSESVKCGGGLEILNCNEGADDGLERFDAEQITLDADGNEVLFLGVYEAASQRNNDHLVGPATVTDTRTAPHTLVLTSYEPVAWTIEVAPGSGLRRVITGGAATQRAVVIGAPIVPEHIEEEESVYGIEAPHESGDGTTERAFKLAAAWAGAPVAHMAGCYQASSFRVSDRAGKCTAPRSDWKPYWFLADSITSGCEGGERFVKFNAQYNKWVGAELCSSSSYKLYLGESRDGDFAPMADSRGHGKAHCALVNPNVSSNDDDEMVGCPSCSAEPFDYWSWPGAIPVYVRSKTREPFRFEETWPSSPGGADGPVSTYITASRYSCGVSIP
jgi:hypothetical protein